MECKVSDACNPAPRSLRQRLQAGCRLVQRQHMSARGSARTCPGGEAQLAASLWLHRLKKPLQELSSRCIAAQEDYAAALREVEVRGPPALSCAVTDHSDQ